jgi:exodeoxyribonuclease VIII
MIPSDEAKDFMKAHKKHDPAAANKLDWDDDQYFADKVYITNSQLKMLQNGGPQHLKAYRKHGQEEKKAFNFGHAVHCLVLEPDAFEGRFYAIDDREICEEIGGAKPRATTKYKEWKAEIKINNASKTLLELNEMNAIYGMVKKLNSLPGVKQLFENTQNESVYWKTIDGVKCKIKVDAKKSDKYMVDLKTMKDPVTVANFAKEMRTRGYDHQGAFYRDISGVDQFLFVAIEKSYPYTIGVFELSEDSYEKGKEKYKRNLDAYRAHFLSKKDNIDSYFVKSLI